MGEIRQNRSKEPNDGYSDDFGRSGELPASSSIDHSSSFEKAAVARFQGGVVAGASTSSQSTAGAPVAKVAQATASIKPAPRRDRRADAAGTARGPR
jgi:hypothetical protein